MSDDFTLPDGYDPDLYDDVGDFLQDNGYRLTDSSNGRTYQHPDTGHTIHLSESDIPQPEYEPDDDVEM